MTIKENSPISLGATAYWMAAVRAQESAREEPLVDDPWAAALAGEQGAEWFAGRPEGSTNPILIRTRFFDDFMLRITSENEIRQVVLVAAGLDTRAFRLRWPEETRLFEIDQHEVLNYKEQILGSAGARQDCDRRVVPEDLTGPWQEALIEGGYDPEQASAWLLEGILFYLPSERILQILEQASELAAPGSWIGFDAINEAMLTSPITKPWIEMQAKLGAPWIGTLDDPEGTLAALGWNATLTQAGQPDANYGRWTLPIIPVNMPGMPHNWFVTAKKKER